MSRPRTSVVSPGTLTPALMEGTTVSDLTHANGDPCESYEERVEREREQRYYDRAVREAAYLDDFGAAEWDV